MKEIGGQVRTSMPHLVIGDDKNKKPDKINNNTIEKDWITKLKEWGLIICVTIVICYAAYRLIS